jgi:nucleoside-diphosphate-sugar epimerase
MREALFCFIALNNTGRGDTVYINGDGNQRRQFIYLPDLIDGYQRASSGFAVGDFQSGRIFNMCGRDDVSVNHVVEVAQAVTGKKAQKVHRAERYGETYRENIIIEQAKLVLGWEPRTPFLDGMNYTFNHDPRFSDIRLSDL